MAVRDKTETTLSEINVTPLVDVMLVLLIIFMVTAPMLSAAVDVNLQKASVNLPTKAKEHVIITVTKERKLFVADTATDKSLLLVRVKEKLALPGIAGVAIRGDREVDYGFILEIIDRLRAGEITNVGLVMAPPEPRPTGGKR